MLNLPIVMLKVLFFLTILFQTQTVTLISPQSGDTLRGQVEINGTMDVPGFSSAELAFAYASSSADSWFIIQTFPQPKVDSPLVVWDTNTITDGDYVLRLRVFLQDGTIQDATVTDLKIRNDAPLPTPTVDEFLQFETPTLATNEEIINQATPVLPFVQPTSLPANPASISQDSIYATFGRGAFIAFLVFGLATLLLYLRKDN